MFEEKEWEEDGSIKGTISKNGHTLSYSVDKKTIENGKTLNIDILFETKKSIYKEFDMDYMK